MKLYYFQANFTDIPKTQKHVQYSTVQYSTGGGDNATTHIDLDLVHVEILSIDRIRQAKISLGVFRISMKDSLVYFKNCFFAVTKLNSKTQPQV